LGQRRLETIEEEGEYQGGKIEEWNEEDEMGTISDPYDEL